MIDTCTRFAAFYGTAMAGRVGYALGFTGLGVAATRFAGDVVLDLLAGADTPRTRLEMVRKKPVPFPPEPFRWVGIEATRRSLARADAKAARRTCGSRRWTSWGWASTPRVLRGQLSPTQPKNRWWARAQSVGRPFFPAATATRTRVAVLVAPSRHERASENRVVSALVL